MALVKTSRLTSGAARTPAKSAPAEPPPATSPRAAKIGVSRVAQASERIAAAAEELASGLVETTAAAEELRRSMEQIAAGAEEAAGASQEQLAAIKSISANLTLSRNVSDTSRRRTQDVQTVLADTAGQITKSVRSIEANAERQQSSAAVIVDLGKRAQDIGEITRTVSRISDQTNLLALNAAIEAARAGDHGRGFAIVADEVRALAETSEKSAQDVQRLAETIQSEMQKVVTAVATSAERARNEAQAGATVVQDLDTMSQNLDAMSEASQATQDAAIEAERAALEAEKAVARVASAAEEQSSATNEVQSVVREQVKSLDQGRVVAQALAAATDALRTGQGDVSEAGRIGVTAEELSATIQELSSAATQIMAAVEQINRGSQQQAAATQQTSGALSQIQKIANQAQADAELASERVGKLADAVAQSRVSMDALVSGVSNALADGRASLRIIGGLEAVSRRIEKNIDAIALVAVQTTMLAVSGAVEAARAGDSGRGFAVVSKDIRNLAREASESAVQAKDTAQAIIEQIGSVRRDLEQTIALAEGEIETNGASLTALQKVSHDVAALADANTAIVRGSDAILIAVSEAAAGARQIASAAEEASAASRQASIAAGEQARGAEDLAAAIEEIASLASELKQTNA